jgi:hypothetical protein
MNPPIMQKNTPPIGEALYEYSHSTAVCMIDGVPGEIRTHDLQLRRLSLYPAELLGQLSFQAVQVIEYPRTDWNSRFFSSFNLFFYDSVKIGHKKTPISMRVHSTGVRTVGMVDSMMSPSSAKKICSETP